MPGDIRPLPLPAKASLVHEPRRFDDGTSSAGLVTEAKAG
jgi:hypothetical protein